MLVVIEVKQFTQQLHGALASYDHGMKPSALNS